MKSIVGAALALCLLFTTQSQAGGYHDRATGVAIAAGILGIVAGALANRGCDGGCYGGYGPYEYGPYENNPYNSYPSYGPPRGYPGYPGPYLGPHPRYGGYPDPGYGRGEFRQERREWRRDTRRY